MQQFHLNLTEGLSIKNYMSSSNLEVFHNSLTELWPLFFTWVFLLILFVFVALRPMSTAMVIAGRSVHLTTLFPGQA